MLDGYARPGSDFYYLLRRVKPDTRQPLLALMAFCQELNHITETYREIQVAEQKLIWWDAEIDRLFIGQPTHPITKHLLPVKDYLSALALHALVEANALSLKIYLFETRAELFQHYQHLGGIRLAQMTMLLRGNPTLQSLHEIGIRNEILRHLIHFRTFLQRQHLYFPMEDFQAFKIDPQPILQLTQLDTLRPLFDEYLKLAQAPYAITQNPSLPKIISLETHLQLKQAKLMKKDTWQFYKRHVELSPLYKLFLTTFS